MAMHATVECEPDDLPSLGDVVDVPELIQTLRESLQVTLATRLGLVWQEQHPGERAPNAMQSLVVTIDFRLLQSICSELARNTAQALMGLTVEAEPI